MNAIVRDVACRNDSLPCHVNIYHALGLPLAVDGDPIDPKEPTDPNDGVHGTRGQVARGIVEAVVPWRRQLDAYRRSTTTPTTTPTLQQVDDPGPLIINLSLGWIVPERDDGARRHPEAEALAFLDEAAPWVGNPADALSNYLGTGYQPTNPLEHRAAIEVVNAALLYASCNGALIIAAAGNIREDSFPGDVVAPAVWAKYPAPTREQCIALGFQPSDGVPGQSNGDDEPLLYPISAVDHYDHPIYVTPRQAITHLVAPGYQVMGKETPITGTSASAAAASGVAALAWTRTPSPISRNALMQSLWNSGDPLPHVDATLRQYGDDTFVDQVRRINVCMLLEQLGSPVSACWTPSRSEVRARDKNTRRSRA